MTTDHEQTGDEELRQRLRAADPARSVPPPTDLAAGLVRRTRERAMQDTEQSTEQSTSEAGAARRRRWVPLLAAAAVLAVAGTAYVVARDGGDTSPPTAAEPTVTALALPTTGSPGRCMQVNAQTVSNAETAFDGTVTAVDDDRVVLEVARWYAGGTADQVELTVPDPGEVGLRLPGQPGFGVGERWLVTATDGRVNVCGFTAPWSPRLAEVFDAAFAG